MKCLAHRLEKTKQRRNETLSGNSQLKAEIDNMRSDKGMYDNIYENLKISLTETTVALWESICRNEKAADMRNRLERKLKNKLEDIQHEKNSHQNDYLQAHGVLAKEHVRDKRVRGSYFSMIDKFKNVTDFNQIDLKDII